MVLFFHKDRKNRRVSVQNYSFAELRPGFAFFILNFTFLPIQSSTAPLTLLTELLGKKSPSMLKLMKRLKLFIN
jgi:hypothetical protein